MEGTWLNFIYGANRVRNASSICIPQSLFSQSLYLSFSLSWVEITVVQKEYFRHVEQFHIKIIALEWQNEPDEPTLISNVAGSTSALKRARDPNVSGADQCWASFKGRPRTSKLKKEGEKSEWLKNELHLIKSSEYIHSNANAKQIKKTWKSSINEIIRCCCDAKTVPTRKNFMQNVCDIELATKSMAFSLNKLNQKKNTIAIIIVWLLKIYNPLKRTCLCSLILSFKHTHAHVHSSSSHVLKSFFASEKREKSAREW